MFSQFKTWLSSNNNNQPINIRSPLYPISQSASFRNFSHTQKAFLKTSNLAYIKISKTLFEAMKKNYKCQERRDEYPQKIHIDITELPKGKICGL